ncbi:MAG: GTP-binding protein [Nitrospiraceae bacterium]
MSTTITTAPVKAVTQPKENLNIVIVGHVDHGKSTLVGRLYADSGSLPEGKLEKVQAICRQQGKEFEYAFLFDAFLEEQEQGITIDTARTFFNWNERQYIIIDAPGHKEFLKNMISGAARAEAALLLIDALEGVKEQSKKHGYLLSLLGVRQFAVVVNKMDLVGYRQDVFEGIEKEYREFLGQFKAVPQQMIPVSAKMGDNIVTPSQHMPWYKGPTVLNTLALFKKERARGEQPLRLPLQDVYKFDARRILTGRITAGRLKVGDQLVFSPPTKRRPFSRSKASMSSHCPPRRKPASRSGSRWMNRFLSSEEKSPPIAMPFPWCRRRFVRTCFGWASVPWRRDDGICFGWRPERLPVKTGRSTASSTPPTLRSPRPARP